MADWKIARRLPHCAHCERAFAEGERHASLLSIRGEELSRSDACLGCFAAAETEAGLELFFWFTKHSPGKRALQLDLGTLEELFLRLEGQTLVGVRELRYVLCLLLMRKRRLKLERVERGPEGEAMLVRRPRREESWKVFVFDFSKERLEQLRAELLEIFEGAEPPGLSEAVSPALEEPAGA